MTKIKQQRIFTRTSCFRSLKNLTGNTPLVNVGPKIYAKLETYNPSGSVKDRLISFIVDRAILHGDIDDQTILCEATSGNTGISLSMIASSLGLPCLIFMPRNMSKERRVMMESYGAKIIDAPDNDFAAAISLRNRFLESNPRAWSPNQFENERNIECHNTTTASEIHRQVIEKIGRPWSAFIHGAGTGGTIEGVRRYIRFHRLETKTCMVVPEESPHGIQGIGDGKEFLAKFKDMDDILKVSTQDAIDRAKQLSRENGLYVGISSGANVLAAERWVKRFHPRGIVVTMLCDRGERYASIYK